LLAVLQFERWISNARAFSLHAVEEVLERLEKVAIHVLECLGIDFLQEWELLLVFLLGLVLVRMQRFLVILQSLVDFVSLVQHLVPKETTAPERLVQDFLLHCVRVDAKLVSDINRRHEHENTYQSGKLGAKSCSFANCIA